MRFEDIVERVYEAHQSHSPLRVRGGGSKDFYGGLLVGDLLDLSTYRGVLAYEPTELYVTARCGTPISEIEALLAERGQMLAFEPPQFGRATLGGCVASGLSGPRRQQVGAIRDFVLGVRMIDGAGQPLSFGGQVMKNVAGYDVSRSLAGSLGTLGILADLTLKVLPQPVAEQTRIFSCTELEALRRLNDWGCQALPISASFWHDGQLWLRLSGAQAAVESAARQLGGEFAVDGENHWKTVREQTHPAYAGSLLWRVALPSAAKPLPIDGLRAIEWGGGLRWYAGESIGCPSLRDVVAQAGGHAVLYRAPESMRCREGVFAPLPPALLALHRRLKTAFDPKGILNPGRLYAEF